MLHRRPLLATSEYPAQKLVTEAPRWRSFTADRGKRERTPAEAIRWGETWDTDNVFPVMRLA